MANNNLQSFKQTIMNMMKSHYKPDSTDRFWLRVKDDMNSGVFWKDVEMYYEDIQSMQDAMMILQNSIFAYEIGRDIHINESHDTHAALINSIFAKFFTLNDYLVYQKFTKMLYRKHQTKSSIGRPDDILRKENFEVLMTMLKATI